jgi:hypothetical protein
MNIPLALIDAIRRLRGSLRATQKRTYVFILVPFDFRGNGRARSAQLEQYLINSRHADNSRSDALFSTLAGLDRPASRTTTERDLNNPQKLNHDLMWTWFLPNPFWPSNKSNSNLASLFRFGLNGFNPNKTRRNN